MKILLTIILFIGLFQKSWGCCAEDDRTLTEMLFQGKAGTIFTCKVLTFSTQLYPDNIVASSSDGSIDGTATAEIVRVYLGTVDTNIVTLRTGSYLAVGKIYLIYTAGNGRVFGFGGNCDRWTKEVKDNAEITNELSILRTFSDIFKNKLSGKFIFRNSNNVILAKGEFKNGRPINIWKHYYNNGIIKAEYDLKRNINSQFASNGFIKRRSTSVNNIDFYEKFSSTINGLLIYSDKQVRNDTGFVMTNCEYFDNGIIKRKSSQIIVNDNGGGCYSGGSTGEYKEYHSNGKLKLQGQYKANTRVGVWIWYSESGELNTKFDYKDGSGAQ